MESNPTEQKSLSAHNNPTRLNTRLRFLLLFVSSTVFAIVWIWLNYLRLEAFSEFIYNAGVNASELIQVARTPSLTNILIEVDPHHPFYLLLSPFFRIFPNVFTLMVLQDLWICYSLIPLYYIVYHFTKDDLISLIFVCSYALFFSVDLTLWEGFGQSQAFFSLFYFTGIYFYLKGDKKSFPFLFLASITNIVVSFSIIILLLYDILRYIFRRLHRYDGRISVISGRSFILYSVLTLLTCFIPLVDLIMQSHLNGLTSLQGRVQTNGNLLSTYLASFLENFGLNSYTFILITVPFLFFFPYKNKFLLTLVPYYVFYFIGGSYGAEYFNTQYFNGSMYAPLVFVVSSATAGILFSYPHRNIKKELNPKKGTNIFLLKKRYLAKIFSAFMLVAVVSVGMYYAPYGPLNSTHIPGMELNAYHDFPAKIRLTKVDVVADSFNSLIPLNSTVLIQNNMAQFANHERNFVFGPGNVPWVYKEPVFPSAGPRPTSLIPDFILINPYGWYTNQFTGNSTQGNMSSWFTYFYTNYSYGLLGASGSFYLYEKNYVGSPKILYYENFSSRAMPVLNMSGNFTGYFNTSAVFLAPGHYIFQNIFNVSGQNGVGSNSSIVSTVSLAEYPSHLHSYSRNNVTMNIDYPGYYIISVHVGNSWSIRKGVTIQYSII